MSTETEPSEDTSSENQINLEKLHLNSEWSDVKFLFNTGNGTESIAANKVVLAAQSDVFAAMFYGELKEKGITVTDASIDGFNEFLQFFYLNRVQLTVENVAEVMNLGHKYNVSKCVGACVQFMKDALTDENVCVCLNHAIFYDNKELQKYCEKFIAIYSEAVFKSKSFLECDKPVLASILNFDSLFCSETVVFEACMAWVKSKSKEKEVTKPLIQEHLGELFYEIRFTSMTAKEFNALNTAHEYAFSFAEYEDIVRTITLPEVMPKLFNGKQRRKMWDEDAVIVCDRKRTDSSIDYYSVPDSISTTFELNRIMLLGQLVFASVEDIYNDLISLPIDVTIVESSNLNNADDRSPRTLSNFKTNLPSQKETTIALPVPVLVRPGLNYEIRLNPLENIDNYRYRSRQLKAEVQTDDELIIKFHGDRNFGSRLINVITGLRFNQVAEFKADKLFLERF